ncbi:AAA family ATPase [Brachyspira pilosicoli]|uniref:AAA family ATPase n=1 Tax=Brachyspira pilosicoli TaxID=52584 RepID=UPI0012F69BC2|nr:AAA family ATPase [Brachyspira pilosicoli]
MKRYVTIKNFRNINPVIINEEASDKEKEDEVKYGRLYLNGDIGQGGLISIIGANGTGKSNILSAVEKAFKGGIDDKRDNPKIDDFLECKPELEIFIETDSGNIYIGKIENDKLVWKLEKINDLTNIIYNILIKNKELEKIYSEMLFDDEEINRYIINYLRKIYYQDEYTYIDKGKFLKCLLDSDYYNINDFYKKYEFNIQKAYRDIENNIIDPNDEFINNIMKYDCELEITSVYVHNKLNIKNEELTINKDNVKNSSFLYSLFKSTSNMETYKYLINNYDYIVSDVSFSKQKENEINRLFEDTISKRFNELYKSNNDYVFKIILETNYIRIYFETKNGLTNLDNESDGFNWFFSLFFNTINPNELKKGDIIIIDEPEQHLSVPLIKELRKFLKQFAKDNGITIITSIQIPYFADINYLDELKIVELKQNGVGVKIENDFSATYGKVDSLEKIINAFGVKHIDITRDTRIIYVEGITDYNYLTAFKLLLEHIENKEINIAFMPINGVGRPNDERQKNDIIKSLSQLSKNPILLIDGDNSADQFTELAKNTNLRITQLKDINPNFITIEDLFDYKDKQTYKINKNNKDALASALFKNNIIDYYENKLISQTTINNFFGVINKYSHIGDNQ